MYNFSLPDHLSSNRSESRSPYAKNYRTNLTHDQREQLSHRQNISRIPRREFEDRHIALLDEYYSLKKENAANNQKIKKMATKLLRLSAEGKSRGEAFPKQLAPNEHLEMQIFRLEAYNSLLKDRLNAIIKKYSSCIQSTLTSTLRRPASCSNLSVKKKNVFSDDDIHLLEIPEPPTVVSKHDNRSSIGSGSGIGASDAKPPTKKQQTLYHFEKTDTSIGPEVISCGSSGREKDCMNNLKNIVHKLEMELNEAKETNYSLHCNNAALKEKLTEQKSTENIELVELRRTMVECEMELHELRDQYMTLKTKAEYDLNKEHTKIDELMRVVQEEIERNKALSKELNELRNANVIDAAQNDKKIDNVSGIPAETIETSGVINKQGSDSIRITELTELLLEAKSTIVELQQEIRNHLIEIDTLRNQNQEYLNQIESMGDSKKPLANTNDTIIPPIPLEPVVIVRGSDVDHIVGTEDATPKVKEADEESLSSQSTVSNDTFIVAKNMMKQKELHNIPNQNINYSTGSEISSLDSDENFHVFQNNNRKMQKAMLLFETDRPTSMLSAQRQSFLEKIAFYRPLEDTARINDTSCHRFMACDCGIECDQRNDLFVENIRKAVKNATSIMLQEIRKNPQMDIDSEINRLDNSSECREFLRVQYNLNNLYKKEIELMHKTYKNEKHALLKQIDTLNSTLQDLRANSSNEEQVILGKPVRMLCVNYDEGSFELHINSFRPTKEGRPLISCQHGEQSNLYLSWHFYDCNSISKTRIRNPPNYVYDSSHLYVVPINEQFLTYLKNEKIVINLFSSTTTTPSNLVGSVDISLAEVLIFPQNKIQLTTKVMSVTSIDCSNDHNKLPFCGCDCVTVAKPKHLGNLTLWFRLTCELDVLKSLYKKQWKPQSEEPDEDYVQISERTLITLTIQSIDFDNTVEPLNSSIEENIHIETDFLGGQKLKTNSKIPSKNQVTFDFTHKVMYSKSNVQRLVNILKDTENSLKLTVVKTPQDADGTLHRESIEVGFGLLHLGKSVQTANDAHALLFRVPILSKQPPYHKIGCLNISIGDMKCLKSLMQKSIYK